MSDRVSQVYDFLAKFKPAFSAALEKGDMAAARSLVDDVFHPNEACSQVLTMVRPVNNDETKGEWLLPDGYDTKRRLLYIHGGGWCFGSLASHRAFVSRLAVATGCAVFSVAYRLAPENPYPAGLDDCISAYKWLLANGPDGAADADHIFIAGDSAGGNLTVAAMVRIRDEGIRSPDGVIPISPSTDALCTSESMESRKNLDRTMSRENILSVRAAYLQHGEDPKHPYISPLYANMENLPPVYFQVGDHEVMRDDSVRFVEKARKAGVAASVDVFPNMPHVFQGYAPFLPEATEAIGRIAAFVIAQTEK